MDIFSHLMQTSSPLIEKRLQEFQELHAKDTTAWFSELCFCILTANARAEKAIALQQEIGKEGFLCYSQEQLTAILYKHCHRFYNNKARFIVQARQYVCIKDLLQGKSSHEAREFLVQHIPGIGYKEASHFLRNVGYHDVAILDRHVLKFLYIHQLIPEIPSTLSRHRYYAIERILTQTGIPLDKLDLLIWHYMTGQVLK